jgi:hypothetical protein
MVGFSKCALAVSVMMVAIVGCTAEREVVAGESDAPDLALDTASEADEGYSYNGWTQSIVASQETSYGWVNAEQTFIRDYGDNARGGGVCLVQHVSGSSCSSDPVCDSWAKGTYGGTAYGYCYSGSCFARPGSGATYCSMSPNRSLATNNLVAQAFTTSYGGNWHALGCMTKAAGPSAACGGTDTSQYMRHVVPMSLWNICDIPGEC